jgi:hypothetical protein
MPAGTLVKWSLSPAYEAAERDVERPLTSTEASAIAWQEIQAESPGIVAINRYRESPHPRVSFANDFSKRLEPQPARAWTQRARAGSERTRWRLGIRLPPRAGSDRRQRRAGIRKTTKPAITLRTPITAAIAEAATRATASAVEAMDGSNASAGHSTTAP